jgi:hypothetical protein
MNEIGWDNLSKKDKEILRKIASLSDGTTFTFLADALKMEEAALSEWLERMGDFVIRKKGLLLVSELCLGFLNDKKIE